MHRSRTFKFAIAVIAALGLASRVALAGPVEDGNAAYKRGDYAIALKLWRPLAEHGNASAQNSIGVMYRDGRGTKRDYAESAKWLRKSAEQGFAPGQIGLGWAYEHGLGVKQDYAEAVKWYRKAAEQGNARAQFNAGIMYRDGRGVKRDHAEAAKWFRKSAEQGYATAQYDLGRAYQHELGVKRNHVEAVKWYRKAAEQGLAVAQGSLGYMYSEGLGVAANPVEAVKWFRRAAEQKYVASEIQLAWAYEYGRGVKQSYVDAIKWYRKADRQGATQAKVGLKRIGDKKLVQAILHALGVYSGPIDGKAGGKTTAAIKQFQKIAEIPQTGQIDSKLVKTLLSRLDLQIAADSTKAIVDEGMKLLRAGFFEASEKKFEIAIDRGYPNTFAPKLYPFSRAHLSIVGTVSLYHWNKVLKQKPISRIGVLTDNHAAKSGESGVRIKGLFPNGPADTAGVKNNDVIVAIDGRSILEEKQFTKYVETVPVGHTIALTIVRDGKRINIQVKTGASFENLAMALFALFEYGIFANEAGHPGITLQAAAALREIAKKYPAAVRGDKFEPFITSLQALAWAAQGQHDKAYRHIVENGGLFRDNLDIVARYIKWFPAAWKPLYENRTKLAYILKITERSLPTPPAARQALQPYPAINGKLIVPTLAPGLGPVPQSAGPHGPAAKPHQPAQGTGAPGVMTLE